MILAPIVQKPSQYTDEERAVIAGALLWHRAGILQALASSERGAVITNDIGQENQRRYYQILEQGNRFMLYWFGYETFKNRMYAPQETVPS